MWRLWLFFGIFKISIGAPVDTPQEILSPAELSALQCLMLTSPLNTCDDAKRSRDIIPRRIQKLYAKLKKPFINAATKEIVSTAEMENIPHTLLYLVPKTRLSAMSGSSASNILRGYPFDDAVTLKITGLLTDDTKWEEFLYGLAGSEAPIEDYSFRDEVQTSVDPALLSPLVESEVAAALARAFPNGSSWDITKFEAAVKAGTPLLASLPNHFLRGLSSKSAEKFLFHLRNWQDEVDPPLSEDSPSISILWSHHPRHVQRMWAYLALERSQAPSHWSPRLLRQWFFVLPGATPDQLAQLPRELRLSPASMLLLRQAWGPMQARAVFDLLFSDRQLESDVLRDVQDMTGLLLPRQLRQFSSNATAFSITARTSVSVSLATEKQLLESQISSSVMKNLLPGVSPATWNHNLTLLGRLVHVLPASSLANFTNSSLPAQALTRIDSPSLAFRQARYLVGKDPAESSLLLLKGLLRAFPAVTVDRQHSNLLPQISKQHLLTFVPTDNPTMAAAVVDKVRSDIGEKPFLESLLNNRDHHSLLRYLSSQDIARKFRDISGALHDIVQNTPELEKSVRSLPMHFLSHLLALHRHEVVVTEGSWTWESLVESRTNPAVKYYIAGLTCADVDALETADVVPVLGYYVREKRALNQAFPKNMQYCCQKALTRYLQLKASLRGLDHETYGLVNLLESHEVKAVGGYVLASLPMELIVSSHLLHQIVGEMGKLTMPELLVALKPANIRFLSHTQTHLDLKGLSHLGNLVWFLDQEHINKIIVDDFRLFLESLEDTSSRALCLDKESRGSWRRLLVQIYGKPDSWSAGVVQLLGDLLFVFDDQDLSTINKTSWTEAGDVLAKYTSFNRLMEWPGKPQEIPFYQVCLDILPEHEEPAYLETIRIVLRHYLEAAQMQLDTVVRAADLLKFHEEPNLIEHVEAIENSSNQAKTTPTSPSPPSTTTPETLDRVWTEPKATSPPLDALLNDQPADDSDDWLYDYDDNIAVDKEMMKKERWRREIRGEEGKAQEGKDARTFRSGGDKTVEERREEMKNATRDLVVEKMEAEEVIATSAIVPRIRDVKISCDALRMVGLSSSMVLDIQDVENWNDTELEDCSEVLGAMDLPMDLRRAILKRLTLWRESGNLLELGSLVAAMEEHDLANVSLELSRPWGLENVAALSSQITDTDLLTSMADALLMELQDPSPAAVASLGRLVCSFPEAHQRKLLLESRDTPLRHVAGVLGRSIPCNTDMFRHCLTNLATLVVDDDAYGETSTWDAHDVASLGVIAAGLAHPEWHEREGKKGLRPEALAGLGPSAVACIPPHIFKDLTEEQLSWLPELSVAAISPAQSSTLSPAQSEVLDRMRRQIPESHLRGTRSSASPIVPFTSALGAIVLSLLVAATRTMKVF